MLESKGFDFNLCTEIIKAGRDFHFCYDQGYCVLTPGEVLLVDRSALSLNTAGKVTPVVYN